MFPTSSQSAQFNSMPPTAPSTQFASTPNGKFFCPPPMNPFLHMMNPEIMHAFRSFAHSSQLSPLSVANQQSQVTVQRKSSAISPPPKLKPATTIFPPQPPPYLNSIPPNCANMKFNSNRSTAPNLFPPLPTAEDQLRLLQQLHMMNLKKLPFFSTSPFIANSKLSREPSTESEEENEIELRVGERTILLHKTKTDQGLLLTRPNCVTNDILVYSVTAKDVKYHAVMFNGGDTVGIGQTLEISTSVISLLPRTFDHLEANLCCLNADKCVATKMIEPGDELVIFDLPTAVLSASRPHSDASDLSATSSNAETRLPTPTTGKTAKEADSLLMSTFMDSTAKKSIQENQRKAIERVRKTIINYEDTVIPPECPSESGYQCERCGKMFTYAYYRDKHLKYTRCVDNGNRKFPCNLCSRSFEKRDRLRIHILHVHENHRPHVCNVCGKAFSQSSSLNKHLRVHSGERPYQCPFCTKCFTASSILRTHIRQHSGEKPFKCAHCGKSFASHAAHDSHVRRTHTTIAPPSLISVVDVEPMQTNEQEF
ncbi:hypothetical protein M3Y96_00286800 [Aphelenchoides besseyi]|nr:hypothetical protein M3Y96_00286800 [Aphelenchoides besseyi]